MNYVYFRGCVVEYFGFAKLVRSLARCAGQNASKGRLDPREWRTGTRKSGEISSQTTNLDQEPVIDRFDHSPTF